MGKHDKHRPSSPGYDSRYRANSEDEEDYRHYDKSDKKYKESDKKYKDKKKYDYEEDSEEERKRREKEEKKERKRREKEGFSGDSGSYRYEDENPRSSGYAYERREEESSSRHSERRREEENSYSERHRDDNRPSGHGHGERPSSRDERSRRFPAEYGSYGAHQESHGYDERPNVYGHPGYGDQPAYGQTYHSPPPPLPLSQGVGYGSGQGAYAHQPTSPPPVQYQPPGYQQNTYGGGGAYSDAYQPRPSPPPPQAGYGSYGGYPPSGPPGPPPPQSYGHGYHPQERPSYDYRPQEQPASYGGYPAQGPYVGYQAPVVPPLGTPGYHSPAPPAHGSHGYHPPPQPPTSGYGSPGYGSTSSAYNAPSSAYNAPSTYNPPPAFDAPSSYNNPSSSYSASSAPYGGVNPAVVAAAASGSLDASKPPSGEGAPSNQAKPGGVLNTFTTGLNSALHDYARTLFPVATTHKPATSLGASGESGAPAQITDKPFDSFAPPRGGNAVKWYVDGKDYMYALSMALENARESIWILDWWLSPELYLRRPPADNYDYRLDRMLGRAAERNVKVNIIVYKEVTQALTLNSSHTKHWLEDLHPNIAVFRHPDHLPDRPTIQQDLMKKFSGGTYSIGDGLKGLYGMSDGVVLYWAHHEKLCLVDGKTAFMGGLDLCFGRWDMNNHPIADAHPGDISRAIFPGQDYNNARLMDFHTVEKWDQNKVLRTESSRMGWSDVALSLMGPTVADLQRHFIQRWNFIYRTKYQVRNDNRFSLLDERLIREPIDYMVEGRTQGFFSKSEQEKRAYGHRNAGVRCQIVRSASKWSHGLSATEHSIAHAYIEIILAAKHFIYIENQFFITATDDKQSPIINKIGRAIVERILTAARLKQKFRIIVVMPAVPAFAGDLQDEGSLGTRAIMEFQYRSICNDRGFSIMEQIEKAGVDPTQYIRFYNLRNYDRINASRTMERVQQAADVHYNTAADAFDERVGGGYGPGTYGYSNPQPEAYPRYQKQAPGGDRWDSVSSCSMLNGGDIRDVPWDGHPDAEMDAFVSEELYVHSKLLIADDQIVICGSANLNDRSQLGDHDSEIAIVIEDQTELRSRMNGEDYIASYYAATLRRQIFRKHLGLIPAQTLGGRPDENMIPTPVPNIYDFNSPEDDLVVDPLSENFWGYWNITAKRNTDAFSTAFHTVPNDLVRNWGEYDDWYTRYFVPSKEEKQRAEIETKKQAAAAAAAGQPKPEGVKAKPLVEWGHVVKSEFSRGPEGVRELKELLSTVKGHLVEMPLYFLREEDIAKEGLGLNALTETIYT